MTIAEIYQYGINDALIGRKPSIPYIAWNKDELVKYYMLGYNSVGNLG